MISIVIPVYGDWKETHSQEIAMAEWSARMQTVKVEVIVGTAPTLATARNAGAHKATGERLVFLDADDWLSLDFCEKIVEPEDVLQPMTSYLEMSPNYLEPRESLLDGNHLIVGCPIKRELFFDIGGFDDWPVYEDWALWIKAWKAGATFGKTTGVYNVRHSPNGRNQSPLGPETYHKIRDYYSL